MHRTIGLALTALLAGCSASGSGQSTTSSSAASGATSTSGTSAGAATGTSGGASSSSGSASSTAATTTGAATSSSSGGGTSSGDAGIWVDVTPSNVVLQDTTSSCGNYGVQTVAVDPGNPAVLYAMWNCQGIWKSSDYGRTWTGPLNNSATVGGAGGVTIAKNPDGGGSPPVLYVSNIRGEVGFFSSFDEGVTWANENIAPAASNRQDVYAPVVDPYDPAHLLMAGHEQDLLVESTDFGHTWTNVPIATDGGALNGGGMFENGGTAAIFFIDTGTASTTRTSFLWMGQASGGLYGTWITSDDGHSWTQVDLGEHSHVCSQIFQAGDGVIYLPQVYSTLGWGVLRSTDDGRTWEHVGGTGSENEAFGTPNNIYATYGWACVPNCNNNISLEVVPQPGTGTWTEPASPPALDTGGGIAEAAVTYDGTHYIIVVAAWDLGLWRYVEP